MQEGLWLKGRLFDTSRLAVKGINRVSDLPGAPQSIIVHRVVDMGHPAYQDALRGISRPWGTVAPLTLQSVIGLTSGTRPNTGLTCWSTHMKYAMGLARPGDVILVTQVPSRDAIIPPNAYANESEVHLHGVIQGCRVIKR